MTRTQLRQIERANKEREFDPKVVAAFQQVFRQGKLEMWAAPLSAA